MKIYVSVICACAVLAFIGSALGDGEGGDIGSQTAAGGASSSTGARVCPEDVDTYSETWVIQEILNIIERCLRQSDQSSKAQMETEQMDNARSFFSDFCQKSPKVSECLAEESSKWEECQKDIQNKLLSIVRDVVEGEVARGCVNNGESLATIVHGLQRITKDFSLENNFVRNCLISSNERAAVVLKNKAHLSSKILFVYHELKTLRDCFIKNVHDDDETFIAVTDDHINKTLDGMKCIHPQDETLVLCKTIDSSLTDRIEICPLRRIDLSSVPISLMLEGKATSCFVGLDLNFLQYVFARSLEEFHTFFRNYCGRQDSVKNCLNENELAAEICLQEPQYNSFKNISDHLKLVLESVCLEDGRRLANIFYTELQRRENSTNQQDIILQCLNYARTNVQGNPLSIIEYYPSFPMLKECLVNKAGRDRTFVNDVESYVNEMITKKKYQYHL